MKGAALSNGGRMAAVVVVLAALAQAPPGEAQSLGTAQQGFSERTYVSIGYVVNAPDQMFGVAAMTVGQKWDGWGLYADVKLTRDTPEEEDSFDPSMTAADVATQLPEDELYKEENAWRSLNGAVVRELGSEFAVYAGAGLTEVTAYDEYQSNERQRTADAFYWVEDEDESGSEVNVLGGILLRASRNLIFHAGAENNPGGATVGVSLGLPLDG